MALREITQLVDEPVGDALRVQREVQALARGLREVPHAALQARGRVFER